MQLPRAFSKHSSKRAQLAGLAAAFVVIAIYQAITFSNDKNQELLRRDIALVNASELRSNLENRITSLLSAARGIIAYVELHGDIGQPEFERFAAALIGDNSLVTNLALLEGSTVYRVHPWEENKAVVGINVLTRPGQVIPFNRMIASGQPVLVGPREVLQGHSAFIGRVPIYRNSVVNSRDRGDYWGSTAIVINADRLYDSTGLFTERGELDIALRSSDADDGTTPVFFGSADVFERQPVTQKIRLPADSYWEIGVVPARGWRYKDRLRQLSILFGFALATVVGFLTYLLVRNQQKIGHNATHDLLSGLPNRRLFLDRFQQAVLAAERYQRSFAVLLLDLDGFKAVNDSLGHAAGDAVIQETAKRLQRSVRASDTVARYGGDEFVLLIQNSDIDDIEAVAEEMRLIVPQTLNHDGRKLQITASIGYAIYPLDGIAMEDLLSQADAALYIAKSRGKNQAVAAQQSA